MKRNQETLTPLAIEIGDVIAVLGKGLLSEAISKLTGPVSHVGIVTGFSGRYPIIISGNSYQRRVYEGTYPHIPIAYVLPG